MPYLPTEEIERLKSPESWKRILSPGELNALFTLRYIDIWRAEPRYHTIHNIRKIAWHLENDEIIDGMVDVLVRHGNDQVDIDAALDLAFFEFYRRVAVVYENHKAKLAGDVYLDTMRELYSTIYELGGSINV